MTYQYLTSVTPQNIDPDAGTFEITGAVASSLVLIDYNWKMPRIDAISLDADGYFHRVRGTSTAFNPQAPLVPEDQLLQIAEYFQDWKSTSTPEVDNNGTRVTSMRDQRQMKQAIVDLYELVADERLQRDISSVSPRRSMACLPIRSSTETRDAGVAQDAVIVTELQLAVNGSPVPVTKNNDNFQLLPYSEVAAVSQPLSTGFMLVNPTATSTPSCVVELILLWISGSSLTSRPPSAPSPSPSALATVHAPP